MVIKNKTGPIVEKQGTLEKAMCVKIVEKTEFKPGAQYLNIKNDNCSGLFCLQLFVF